MKHRHIELITCTSNRRSSPPVCRAPNKSDHTFCEILFLSEESAEPKLWVSPAPTRVRAPPEQSWGSHSTACLGEQPHCFPEPRSFSSQWRLVDAADRHVLGPTVLVTAVARSVLLGVRALKSQHYSQTAHQPRSCLFPFTVTGSPSLNHRPPSPQPQLGHPGRSFRTS